MFSFCSLDAGCSYRNKCGLFKYVWFSFCFAGYLYDITGDYRPSFYVAGTGMLLNCFVVLMDRVWRKLDNLRLRSKEDIEETNCNDLKVYGRGERSGDERQREGGDKDDMGISNPVMTAFYSGQDDRNGIDHFL